MRRTFRVNRTAVLLLAGVACLTIGLFVAIRLWPSQGPKSQKSPNTEHGADALFPGRGVPEREKDERVQIAKETDEETVRNLLEKGHLLSYWQSYYSRGGNNESVFNAVRDEPRVRKLLLSLARDGSEANKKRLLELVTEMCHVYLELPKFQPRGSPWKPTLTNASPAKAYAYLLTQLDDDAVSLPLLVEMNLRFQSAMLDYMETFEGHPNDGKWGASEFGLVLAYACDHFLTLYSSREDLRRKLTDEQLEILGPYEKFRAESLVLDQDQLDILRIATEFVEAGAKD